MARAFATWLVCASLLASGAQALAAGGRLEGQLVLGHGGVLLVRTAGGLEVIQVQPATTLLGVSTPEGFVSGERLRANWTRQMAGVKLADVVESDPPVAPASRETLLTAAEVAPRLLVPPGKKRDLVALDVRPRTRWEEGHLPGAISLPAERIGELAGRIPDRSAAILMYSEGPRCPLALAALRRARDLGYEGARVLDAGFAAWWGAGLPLEMEPAGLARVRARGDRLVIVDLRAEANAKGTVPGAMALPPSAMHHEDFSGPAWLPPVVLVGKDGDDPAPFEAAQQIQLWRSGGAWPADQPPLVLSGGLARWAAQRRTAPPRAPPQGRLSSSFVDVRAGEVSHGEFVALWSARGEAGPLLLDVRPVAFPDVPGTRHLALERLAAEIGQLPRDREIVAFCSVGKRSAIAYEILKRNGFRVRYLRGMPPG